MAEQADLREAVRQRYATAALNVLESDGGSCCGPPGCGSTDPVTTDLYLPGTLLQRELWRRRWGVGTQRH